jgi:CheY-like chemotaxis protein
MYHSSLLLNGLQVLVVDSDPDSRYLLTTLFEMYGTLTLTATTATVALEILFSVKPDLLIARNWLAQRRWLLANAQSESP